MEYRMYHFVIYQLSGIQAGIQASHARDEYPELFYDQDYFAWRKSNKTVIILNGGNTNSQGFDYYSKLSYKGTMQIYMEQLQEKGINIAPFYEPDLNNALTGFAFLVNEMVYDKKKYPDALLPNVVKRILDPNVEREMQLIENTRKYGENVAWLRDFLSDKKLATN